MLRKIADLRIRDVLEILTTNNEGEKIGIPYRISKFVGKTGALLKLADENFKGMVKNKMETSIKKIKNSKKLNRYDNFKRVDD